MSATSIATALLVSDRTATVSILAECLSELAIATETCSHNDAVSLINRKKFEAVIIDSYLNGRGESLLDAVRCSCSNRNAVTFAISEQTAQASTLGEGPTFILEAPLSRSAIDETLKKSFDMIVRERRRYFRCSTLIVGTLSTEGSDTYNCRIVNISESGVRLITFTKLQRGTVVALRFTLPGTPSTQDVCCEVCWFDPSGRAAGLRFVSQSTAQRTELEAWLTRRLENILPERFLVKFRCATSNDF
jgi:PilZ domain